MRIAMWSGPRNLSTAMMYSFAARSDCRVVDEPFYAAYLARSGVVHPMNTQILASQPTDPDQVAAELLGPIPQGCAHFYQKHMTHHMLDDMPLSWLDSMTNVFLIRHPARVVASYARKREGPRLADIGFRQQAEIFDKVCALGQKPIVVDSADIRANPEHLLRALCCELGIEWQPEMLHWAPGGHPSDGVWAAHWYGAVHQSTGFDGPEQTFPVLSDEYSDLEKEAMPYYHRLFSERLT